MAKEPDKKRATPATTPVAKLSPAEEFWESLGTHGQPLSVEKLAKYALERPISRQDMDYLISLHPYLDICNADIREPPADTVKATTIEVSTGWVIYDRGDRLTAGPGRLTYGGYRLRPALADIDEDEDGTAGGGNQIPQTAWVMPEGTLVKQIYDTAIEMILLAEARWPAAEILGGYYVMQRAAWMAAQDRQYSLNYGPTAIDQEIYQTIQSHGGLFNVNRRGPKPK